MSTKLPKALLLAFIFFVISCVKPQTKVVAFSQDAAASSASLTTLTQGLQKPDGRVRQLRLFLEKYNSPLTGYSDDFISLADKYGVDWKLVPAITGVESSFGVAIPQNSYNAYGWANGAFNFESWPDSIEVVTKALKENYIDRGADTVWKIAPIYAPPSTTWAGKVNHFMTEIENFGLKTTQDPTSLALSL